MHFVSPCGCIYVDIYTPREERKREIMWGVLSMCQALGWGLFKYSHLIREFLWVSVVNKENWGSKQWGNVLHLILVVCRQMLRTLWLESPCSWARHNKEWNNLNQKLKENWINMKLIELIAKKICSIQFLKNTWCLIL